MNRKSKPASKQIRGRIKQRAARRPRASQPRSRPRVAVETAPAEAVPSPSVPVVAIGASAGGLDAFTQVLEGLTENPGVALVFIQHLAPQHESALPILLSGRTRLPVVQVTEGTHVEPDHVYVIPPNAQMEIRDGDLHLNPRPDDRTQYTPIDFFFRSLAETAGGAAIGVVLSGSSSDGAAGLREIKAVGGITIAQEPDTARYDGMPRAAIATDAVDLVLAPADIAREIVRIGRHPYVRQVRPRHEGDEVTIEDDSLRQIVAGLRGASGIDFSHYKTPTIKRRLQRRMMLQKISDVRQYLEFLRATPDEAQKLAQDILIHVTRFFRDPESFVALDKEVFPEILANRSGDDAIRVWVPGCSTGEEAYSVGIALLEFVGERSAGTPIQIFATDVSEWAIENARLGIYPQTIGADVSSERLRRFFAKTDGSFRINKFVRDLCVFARQDLARDPPFSKLDLIVCRNVLIYLGSALQHRLLGVFHYALRPSAFLMLGEAETTGSQTELFTLVDKKNRIYRKTRDGVAQPVALQMHPGAMRSGPATSRRLEARPAASTQSEAQRFMLEHYAPPGVIVDDDLRIVQFIGHTGRFLESPPGEANLTLPKMVRDGLLNGLRTALQEARREERVARRGGLHLRHDGHELEVAIEVAPLSASGVKDRHYLVTFQEKPSTEPSAARQTGGRRKGPERRDSRVARLEDELAASREYLQSIIQELEAANEELQSANEEILSSNEELQSTNEELDTAKEELQSTNEELNTVNEELHGRNEEMSQVNSDLVNLLASVQVPLVIVESDLRIRRFTPMAERVLNLIPSDIGRPIGHIKPNIDCADLEERVRNVVEEVVAQALDVRDRQGRWYSLNIRPYKNVDNRIDGAVLALFDIDAAKRHEAQIETARQFADAIIQTIRESLVVLDRDLRVKTVNKAFRDTFGVSAKDTEGRLFYEIGDGQWDVPALRARLAEVLERDGQIEALEVEHDFPAIGHRRMLLNARRIEQRDGSPELVLLAIEDVTAHPERKGT